MKPVIKATSIKKTYKLGKTTVTGVEDINLEVPPRAFLAIAGPSGSGKSTLLNLFGCLDTPCSGELEIDNELVTQFKPKQLAELRNRKIGFIFQTFNLIAVLSAFENVEFPLILLNYSKTERHRMVHEALAAVGLERHGHHRPEEMSGGQPKRFWCSRTSQRPTWIPVRGMRSSTLCWK